MLSEATYERELANLRKENEYLRKRLSHFGSLSRKITHSLELPTVLQDIVDSACDLTGAKYGAIGVFDEYGRVQTFVTHGITAEEREALGGCRRVLDCWECSRETRGPCGSPTSPSTHDR